MSFHLLEQDREGALRLAEALNQAATHVGHCQKCRTLTELDVCRICLDPKRKVDTLCVVESPSEVLAIEQATNFKGMYFVLMGKLSPLDGIGPEDIGLDLLEIRLSEGQIQELILATNTTVEGEVTAHYISELASKHDVSTSRIAHGVPVGGELGYIDSSTLSHAFEGRRQY